MKVLSLKQPFAELILQGKKKIELRKWNTHFRGEFLIHASKIPYRDFMKSFGFEELPCGFIVGKAELFDVKEYKNAEELREDQNLHLASGEWGKFGFILRNPQRIKPIPAKGSLNFWDFELNNKKPA